MGKGDIRTRPLTAFLCSFLLLLAAAPTPSHGSAWRWQNPLPQGNTLHTVWSARSGEVFAAGDRGTILVFSPALQTPVVFGNTTTNDILALWGTSSRDVFAAGASGTILHFDGSEWITMHSGTREHLWGVWGSAPNDVFAVGSGGTILHYDGNSWQPMKSPTTKTLRSVWGISRELVFAAGYDGTVVRYNGVDWSVEQVGTHRDLYCIKGISGIDVFASGAEGTLLHFDGAAWKPLNSPDLRGDFSCLAAGYDGMVFVATQKGDVFSYNGKKIIKLTSPPVPGGLTGMCRTPDGLLYLVGSMGTFLCGDTGTWNSLATGLRTEFSTIGRGHGNDVIASGSGGAFAVYDGVAWRQVDAGMTKGVSAVWRDAASDKIFVVGEKGMIRRHDGRSWHEMTSPTSENLNDIWGVSEKDVFAVGDGGTILHFDGFDWVPMKSNTSKDLRSVWGYSRESVYAVGENGVILRYDGDAWEALPRKTAHTLNGLWGSSERDLFAVGDMGTVLHFDGSSWSTMDTGMLMDLHSVWGSGADDVYAVGEKGTMLHFDGSSWSLLHPMTTLDLMAVWGSSADDVYVAGQGGVILHYGTSADRAMNTVAHARDARSTVGDPDMYAARTAFVPEDEALDGVTGETVDAQVVFQRRKNASKSLLEFLAILAEEKGLSRGGQALADAGSATGGTDGRSTTMLAATESQKVTAAEKARSETLVADLGVPAGAMDTNSSPSHVSVPDDGGAGTRGAASMAPMDTMPETRVALGGKEPTPVAAGSRPSAEQPSEPPGLTPSTDLAGIAQEAGPGTPGVASTTEAGVGSNEVAEAARSQNDAISPAGKAEGLKSDELLARLDGSTSKPAETQGSLTVEGDRGIGGNTSVEETGPQEVTVASAETGTAPAKAGDKDEPAPAGIDQGAFTHHPSSGQTPSPEVRGEDRRTSARSLASIKPEGGDDHGTGGDMSGPGQAGDSTGARTPTSVASMAPAQDAVSGAQPSAKAGSTSLGSTATPGGMPTHARPYYPAESIYTHVLQWILALSLAGFFLFGLITTLVWREERVHRILLHLTSQVTPEK